MLRFTKAFGMAYGPRVLFRVVVYRKMRVACWTRQRFWVYVLVGNMEAPDRVPRCCLGSEVRDMMAQVEVRR